MKSVLLPLPYSIRTYHFYFLQRPVCIPVLNNFSSFNSHFLVTHIQPMLVNAFSTTPPAALFQLRDTLSLLSHPTGNVLSQAKQDLYFFPLKPLSLYVWFIEISAYLRNEVSSCNLLCFFFFFFLRGNSIRFTRGHWHDYESHRSSRINHRSKSRGNFDRLRFDFDDSLFILL